MISKKVLVAHQIMIVGSDTINVIAKMVRRTIEIPQEVIENEPTYYRENNKGRK